MWMPSLSARRSEEHTSELQSLRHLVWRLLLDKNSGQQSTRSTLLLSSDTSSEPLAHGPPGRCSAGLRRAQCPPANQWRAIRTLYFFFIDPDPTETDLLPAPNALPT